MTTVTPAEIYDEGIEATVSTEHNSFTGQIAHIIDEYVVVTENVNEAGEIQSYEVTRVFEPDVISLQMHNCAADLEMDVNE